jgi:hypothetical protein
MSPGEAYHPGDVLIATDEIADVVARLGREISSDYGEKNPILVNLLKGGVVFLADLIRQLPIPHQIEFLSVSSYDQGTASSGVVRIVEDLKTNVTDRDVLVVEDVLDTASNPRAAQPGSVFAAEEGFPPERSYQGQISREGHSRRFRGGIRSGLRRKVPKLALFSRTCDSR